ncbi:unnamed protein product [Closterium sp. NIES-54]
MEVARTSMIHAATPHFLWPFAVRYAAHQLNLWPRAFRVWGALSLVRDTTAGKLSPRTLRCVFLGFPTDASPWQFYNRASCHVLSSQEVLVLEVLELEVLEVLELLALEVMELEVLAMLELLDVVVLEVLELEELEVLELLAVQSQPQLLPGSPLPASSPYPVQTGSLVDRRKHASRPASPVRTVRRAHCPRPPPIPVTHTMVLRPSSVPQHAALPSPSASSLPDVPDPESHLAHAASPTVTRLLATDLSFESTAASALVIELVDFAATR